MMRLILPYLKLPIPIPFLIIILIILVGAFFKLSFFKRKFNSNAHLVSHRIVGLFGLLFFSRMIPFHLIYEGVYYVFLFGLLGLLIYSSFKIKIFLNSKFRNVFWIILNSLLGILFLGGFIYNNQGRELKKNSSIIALDFPLKHGKFWIMQGGSNTTMNPFHGGFSWKKYGYAIDISKIPFRGSLSRIKGNNLFSKVPSDYAIFGDTVFSPCTGTIMVASDSLPDQNCGQLWYKPVHGNHIFIKHQGKYKILLAHLKQGSLMVKKGDKVVAGQPIALQGNTGWTIEPHVHIHAWINWEKDPKKEGESVPIVFNNGVGFLWMGKELEVK